MENIKYTLRRWGAWAREPLPGKARCAWPVIPAPRRRSHVVPLSDDEARIFEPVMAALKEKDPEGYGIIEQRYIAGFTYSRIASERGEDRRKIYACGYEAEAFIHGAASMLSYVCATDKKR